MTVYWMEGFTGWVKNTNLGADYLAAHGWRDLYMNASSVTVKANPDGYNALECSGGTYAANVYFPVLENRNPFVFGFTSYTRTSGVQTISFRDSDGVALTVGFSGSVNPTVYISYNPTGTVNDITWSMYLDNGPTAYYELDINDTRLELYINDSLVFTKVWDSLAVTWSAYGGVLKTKGTAGGGGIANLYVADTRLGPVRILPLTNVAEVSNTGTVVSGTSPALFDTVDGETSYESLAASSGQSVVLGQDWLAPDGGNVKALGVRMQYRGDFTGEAKGNVTAKTGSTNVIGSVVTDSVEFLQVKFISELDPHTAAPYTRAAIGTLELGVVETA